ncbi:restriction endonuclease subunit S [Bacteroides acidifaciens]|uniref:restriction endonuclease subunit S n=1 Tax=Bacteroides acidifaciens TaxID=85831 RepID=UPI00214A2867|nr:restriction endonuclease subunit S [Bacteroides acidifaciens]MCR2005643.1 restriction endonuclease subunit S [Bacteroides acidifaciens]
MEEWKLYRLLDLTDLIAGFAFKSADFSSVGFPVVKIKDIQPPFVNIEGTDKVNLSSYNTNKLQKFLISKGDFLLAMTGATIGKIGRYINEEQAYINQRVLKFVPKACVDSKFVYYCLFTHEFQSYVMNHIDSESAQPNISANTIGKYELAIPNIETQKKITNILSSLDSKIELNRRINDNLEQQAQALFKSWFVDFEPFRGEKFVESQLGMIPKGWKVGTLSDLLDIRYGKDHKKLNDGNIPVYGSGGIMRLADGILYNGESVLIPRKGTLNNVLYVNWPFWTVDTMFYSIEKVPNVAKYCHLLLSKLDLASMNSGSAVPSMTTDILNKIQVIIANQNVFSSFNECISSLYLKAKINLDENKRLSETRDLLLPKLMSGRLIIKDLHS